MARPGSENRFGVPGADFRLKLRQPSGYRLPPSGALLFD
jgi:hypothetical protein